MYIDSTVDKIRFVIFVIKRPSLGPQIDKSPCAGLSSFLELTFF